MGEDRYRKLVEKWGSEAFKAGMGAEAVKELLKQINLDELSKELRLKLHKATSIKTREKLAKRLQVVEALRKSGNRPEWMVMDVIPVLPPDLRPLVPLDGDKFATSDINDLYRRVINRNNRLKRLLELNAPDIITRNEKRMLQETVEALLDNSRRGRVITGQNKRALKSLSDMIKGKGGRFRQNLLGKRVDYSGTSVIVPGPELKLYQCGLPKKMALELFKPFIYSKLEKKGYATTIKRAKKLVEQERPEVWDILEEVAKGHPVILNRFPTLHRLNISSFEPVLTDDKAIRLNPLVCPAFNADFDGGQMNVHIPLSAEAQTEARVLMMPENNVLSPSNGRPIILPTEEIVLGIFYLTKEKVGVKGEGKILSSPEEVRMAYDAGCLSVHARIGVRIDKEIVETTTGRLLLREIMPDGIPFSFINKAITWKDIERLICYSYSKIGVKQTIELLNKVVSLGLEYVTRSGLSIGIDDFKTPIWKDAIVEEAQQKIRKIRKVFDDGMITREELSMLTIETWEKAGNVMKKEIGKTFNEESPSFNIISMMLKSGVRGDLSKISQIAGIKGVVTNLAGERFEYGVTSNYRDGLSPLEFFITSFSVKGKESVTNNLMTHSGHLNRKLIYAVQNVIITEKDCGTGEGITIAIKDGIEDSIIGRIAAEEVRDPFTGEIVVNRDCEITGDIARRIKDAG
ncbi:MAG: DNA-directed RNA polymerase subunit beta', partial [Thermodesulfobacteriota bacterium]